MKQVIDRNVPFPTWKGKGRYAKYPWPDMEVGDSVFFDDQPTGTKSKQAFAARAWGRTQSVKKTFAARKEGKGVRIWRIA